MPTKIPLGKLISVDTNIYELTNAAIHRARLLGLTRKEDMATADEKLTSVAIAEIVSGEVQYSIRHK